MDKRTGRITKATGDQSRLYNAAQRFRSGLIAREDAAIQSLSRLYRATIRKADADLARLDARIADALDRGMDVGEATALMRERLVNTIDTFGRELAALSNDASAIVASGQQDAMDFAVENTPGLVNAAAGVNPVAPTVAIALTQPDSAALRAFAGFASDGSPLSDLFASIANDQPQVMRNILSSAIGTGENPRAIIGQIRRTTGIPAARAETIARTEMIRASREAQRLMYEDAPSVTGFQRQAAQDQRVCLACLALSGTKQPTNEILPSHPNCRCVMVPVTLSWAEITGDPSIPDTRAEAAGPQELLDGLDDAEKMLVFGPKRWALYQAGTPLDQMVEVVNDPTWGPTTKIKPLRNIGQGGI